MSVENDLTERLLSYIRDRSDLAESEPRITGLERMAEGWSRESFAFDLWVGDSEPRRMILRRDPPASLLTTDREVEFQVIRVLGEKGFEVPRVYWFDKDPKWLGSPFMIMEMLPGTSVPEVLYAPGFASERQAIGKQFFSFLGRLHAVDPASLDLNHVLGSFSNSEDATLREIDHWFEVIERNKPEPQPVLHEVMHWLRANIPPSLRLSLLHGDYRSGNFLFEGGRLTGVVDWELATLGDPRQDLGWVFMDLWRLEGKACGFFGDDECLQTYSEYAGFVVDRSELDYWIVLAYYKLSAIAMQSIRTAIDGRNREVQFATSHLWVPGFLDYMARVVGF